MTRPNGRQPPSRLACSSAFSPFLGLHTLLGLAFAFLLNMNRVAVLLGVYSNLPWFLGPYYAIATMVGAQLTGQHIPRGFRAQLRSLFELSMFQGDFWHRLAVVLRPLVWPYTVGSLDCARRCWRRPRIRWRWPSSRAGGG